MRSKQNPLWILLCVFVCLVVGVSILACLPAWDGMGDMSALEAIFYYLEHLKQ